MSENQDQVLIDFIDSSSSGKRVAVATLNAEKSLNSLTGVMIEILDEKLEEWEHDDSIAAVMLKGAGEKAFCAGGDIRALYDEMIKHEPGTPVPRANEFFEKEYALDFQIHTYRKPIINLGHGIIMGGGLGLHAGASHRIVSERSTIAMPEITIGLYPEVGASWFLNRMPGRAGLFLGLTGTRMKAADALYAGLADFFIPRERHSEIEDKLKEMQWSDDSSENSILLNKCLRKMQAASRADYEEQISYSELRNHFDFIQDVTAVDSVLEFKNRLDELQVEDKWVAHAQKTFAAGSPTSAGVIFHQLEHTKHFSLRECFDFEYKLSCKFAMHPDFREGIRALIVDKDNNPKWSPASIMELNGPDIQKLLSYKA